MLIETAVVRMLRAQAAIVGAVGDRVYAHQLPGAGVVEPHGRQALVVLRDGGHGLTPNRTGHESPLIVVWCWSDRTRNADGFDHTDDARPRALGLAALVRSVMANRRGVRWGGTDGVWVIESHIRGEPVAIPAGELAHVTGVAADDACAARVTFEVQHLPTVAPAAVVGVTELGG